MGTYWHGFRAFAIAFWVIEAFLFLICAVAYLIPVAQPQAEISPDDLAGKHGPFLDIDEASVYVEEQNPDLFNNMVLTFLRSHGD